MKNAPMPSKRKPAPKPPTKIAPKPTPKPKPEPMSPRALESLRNSSRMEEQDRNNRAAERFFGNPDPESAGYAKGGMTKGKKELPFFMKKDALKAKAKPKKMMGGGSCK